MAVQPEPESSPEPENWPSTPEPEAEVSTTVCSHGGCPEPEVLHSTPSTEPEPTTSVFDAPFAEPVPDWDIAKAQFGVAWEVHVYGVGSLSAILAAMAVINVIIIATIPKLNSRGYFIALNVLAFLFGTIRSVYLFVDAYNSHGIFSPIIAYFVINFGYPCLTTMFYILFAALFRLTKLQRIGSKIFAKRYLIGISCLFFFMQITADIVVGVTFSAWLLAIICEIFFIIWGFVYCIMFSVVFIRLYHGILVRRNLMKSMSNSQTSLNQMRKISTASAAASTPQRSTPRGSNASLSQVGTVTSQTMDTTILITAVAAIFFFALGVAHTYGMSSSNSLITKDPPDPWTWWIYNFTLRIIELCMVFTILFVAMSPVRRRRHLLKKAETPLWLANSTTSQNRLNVNHNACRVSAAELYVQRAEPESLQTRL